jgi:hypothetical protein
VTRNTDLHNLHLSVTKPDPYVQCESADVYFSIYQIPEASHYNPFRLIMDENSPLINGIQAPILDSSPSTAVNTHPEDETQLHDTGNMELSLWQVLPMVPGLALGYVDLGLNFFINRHY